MTPSLSDGRTRFVLVVLVVIASLVGDGVYAALGFRASLQRAACYLARASSDPESLDVVRLDRYLDRALSNVQRARGYLNHPAMEVAGAIPAIGRDVEVLEVLTEVADWAVHSGRLGVALVRELGLLQESSLDAIYREGRVDLSSLAKARRSIEDVGVHLGAAQESLDAAPRATLGSIRKAHSAAASLVARSSRLLHDASVVLEDLPGILGGRGERRYLLAFQAPSEARGGGGLIGVYGILRVSEGAFELLKVAPIRDLVPRLEGEVGGPEWFEDLYGALDGLGGFREANLSPTFPTTSRVLLRMYERATDDRLDGVLAIDPIVVSEILIALDPLDVPGYPESIHANNAERILMRDIYLRFGRREADQNLFLRRLVDAVWERVDRGEIDGDRLLDAVSRSITGGRLKFFPSHRKERDGVAVARADGNPRAYAPNAQMIFHNNFGANKVDWFLSRAQSTRVAIAEDGSASVEVEIELVNHAPRGHRSALKKSDLNEIPSGRNLMGLFFMLPRGAEVQEMLSGSTPIQYLQGSEAGTFPTVWAPLQVGVGGDAVATVTYEVPSFIRFRAGRGRFVMSFLPQGLVRPEMFELSVTLPPGYRIAPRGAELQARLFKSGKLLRVRTMRADILAPGVEPRPHGDVGLAGVCV